MATAFFNTTSPFGALTGWEINNETPTSSNDRAQALNAEGDELAHAEYNAKTTVSATYVIKAITAGQTRKIPKFGEILNGYHVDSVSISFTNTGFVGMTITGHKHGSAAHPVCRTYTGSLAAIVAEFGCPATLTGFDIPDNAGVRSYTWTLDGNHQDELNGTGNFLGAENYDGKESVDCELCDTGAITAASGWTLMTAANPTGNTVAETSTASAEHHIAHDAV